MTEGKYPNFVPDWQKPIQGDTTGLTKRDDELSDLTLDSSPDKWVLYQHLYRTTNGRSCAPHGPKGPPTTCLALVWRCV